MTSRERELQRLIAKLQRLEEREKLNRHLFDEIGDSILYLGENMRQVNQWLEEPNAR